MAIRNSAKAIVINHGKILLNRCTSRFGEYYALPGGGQNPGETLQEAVQRELLEETGYRVKPLRLSGIYESVADRTGTEDGCLCHKIYFIFVCRLMDPHPGLGGFAENPHGKSVSPRHSGQSDGAFEYRGRHLHRF